MKGISFHSALFTCERKNPSATNYYASIDHELLIHTHIRYTYVCMYVYVYLFIFFEEIDFHFFSLAKMARFTHSRGGR